MSSSVKWGGWALSSLPALSSITVNSKTEGEATALGEGEAERFPPPSESFPGIAVPETEGEKLASSFDYQKQTLSRWQTKTNTVWAVTLCFLQILPSSTGLYLTPPKYKTDKLKFKNLDIVIMTEWQMGTDEIQRLPAPRVWIALRVQAQCGGHRCSSARLFIAAHLGELDLAELIVRGGPLLYTLSSMPRSCERNQNNVSNFKQKEVTLKTSMFAPHRSKELTQIGLPI